MQDADVRMAEILDDCPGGRNSDILAPTTRVLVAIAAAAAVNCHTCLRHLIPAALENGILQDEVTATVALTRTIRHQAGRFTDGLAGSLVQQGNSDPADAGSGDRCC